MRNRSFLRLRQGFTATGVLVIASMAAFGQSGTPQAVLSYIAEPSGNQTGIQNGQTLPFAATALGQTRSATIIITNRGTASDTLRSAAVSSENFRVSGLPLLPASIGVDRELRFTVAFQPNSRGALESQLRIELGSRSVTIRLQGEGTGPALVYDLRHEEETTPLSPGGVVQIPATAVNGTRTVQLRISNRGNAEGRISSVSLTGAAYQFVDSPLLPLAIAPGSAVSLSIRFTPRESGRASGQLRLDTVPFVLEGIGLGSQFTLSIGGIVIGDNGIIFPGTPVGGEATVRVAIQNTGTTAGAIQGIGLTGNGFRLRALPALPQTLEPNEQIQVTLAFLPDALVVSTGTLQVDSRSVSLRGPAAPPPALPSITISGAAETVDPLQQPTLGIELAETYPLELTGRLTLSFQSETLVDDPAIQFATGGRTVDFRVPPNTREAVFAAGLTQMPFQSGSIAGSIRATATLQVATVNVTPDALSRTISVAGGSPRIQRLQIGTRNERGFELLISGLSPSRSVSDLTFTFEPAAGSTLQNATLTIPVQETFDTWYRSSASRTFGSQFTASVFLNVSGSLDNIQSVSVTARGPGGASTPRSINLR